MENRDREKQREEHRPDIPVPPDEKPPAPVKEPPGDNPPAIDEDDPEKQRVRIVCIE